jgi:hypothetical protein
VILADPTKRIPPTTIAVIRQGRARAAVWRARALPSSEAFQGLTVLIIGSGLLKIVAGLIAPSIA